MWKFISIVLLLVASYVSGVVTAKYLPVCVHVNCEHECHQHDCECCK